MNYWKLLGKCGALASSLTLFGAYVAYRWRADLLFSGEAPPALVSDHEPPLAVNQDPALEQWLRSDQVSAAQLRPLPRSYPAGAAAASATAQWATVPPRAERSTDDTDDGLAPAQFKGPARAAKNRRRAAVSSSEFDADSDVPKPSKAKSNAAGVRRASEIDADETAAAAIPAARPAMNSSSESKRLRDLESQYELRLRRAMISSSKSIVLTSDENRPWARPPLPPSNAQYPADAKAAPPSPSPNGPSTRAAGDAQQRAMMGGSKSAPVLRPSR